ncbi:MAG TPA: hypothetical protein DCY35_10265 [Prolixibacteraceae bacterium]|nr:hypothetical protein [Prolixibacteraceae bacterium]
MPIEEHSLHFIGFVDCCDRWLISQCLQTRRILVQSEDYEMKALSNGQLRMNTMKTGIVSALTMMVPGRLMVSTSGLGSLYQVIPHQGLATNRNIWKLKQRIGARFLGSMQRYQLSMAISNTVW